MILWVGPLYIDAYLHLIIMAAIDVLGLGFQNRRFDLTLTIPEMKNMLINNLRRSISESSSAVAVFIVVNFCGWMDLTEIV